MKRSHPPRIFRLLVPSTDPDRSRRFYESLLGVRGRPVAPGRVYFDCGPVVLGVLDYSRVDPSEITKPTEAVYFATDDLDVLFRRARRLGCLSPDLIHNDPGSPAGKVVVRPWGERSFYATDPSGNALCFVDGSTLFTGTPAQVASTVRHSARTSGSPAKTGRRRPVARRRA